jgi:uncharacterized protein
MTSALNFTGPDRIGRVAAVDTTRIFIDVEDHNLLTRLSVGNLIAVQGSTPQEYLIAIAERITRQIREEAILEQEDASGAVPIGEAKEDVIRAVLIGTFRIRDGGATNTFKRGADSFPQIDRDCYLIQAGNLQNLMNLLAKGLPEDKRLQLGHFVIDTSVVAVADGDRFFQRHASILGSTGSGKSCSVALILEKASKLTHPNIIVLDMHGEYKPLTQGEGAFAQGYRVAGPGDLDKADPNVLFLPYWLLNREEMLAMLLDRSDQNAPNQAARFTAHVRALKDSMLKTLKKEDVRKTFTVDSPIPYPLQELIDLLKADNVEMVAGSSREKQGDWYGRLTRFIARLESKIEDRRYGFLFNPPKEASEYEWLSQQMVKLMGTDDKQKGIKIIDFSEVPPDVLPVVVGVFARLLFDVQFWLSPDKRTPITIVCDEAHLYLPIQDNADSVERRALEAFEGIAKEGRKYGISLVVVSQRPSDVSRTILSQCNNFLVLRLTNDQDQNVVRRLVPDSMSGLTEMLPLLDAGEALLLGDAVLLPMRIKLTMPTIRPDSATREFWTEWGHIPSDSASIAAAIETLRSQTRPS